MTGAGIQSTATTRRADPRTVYDLGKNDGDAQRVSILAPPSSILTPMAGSRTQRTQRLRGLFALTFLVGMMAPALASAQSARASFFLQMLRQNPDARVRVSAALRLGELREAATVDPLGQIFTAERDVTVLSAIVSTLGSIGDVRALPTLQAASRHSNPAVRAQARRALPAIQALASGGGAAQGGSTAPSAGSGSARFLVGVGTVANNSGQAASLQQIARSAIESALQTHPEVVVHAGSAAQGTTMMRSQHLSGHFFDANIQSVQPRGAGVRAAVSIVVTSYPGRAYEFASETAITISGGSAGSPQATEDAVRRAMESAANRAVNQLMQGTP